VNGRKVRTVDRANVESTQSLDTGKFTVAYEARLIKHMLLKVISCT
jgi:hypothetical protein